MKKIILLTLLLTPFFISCSQEDPVEIEKQTNVLDLSNKLSLDEAVRTAEEAFIRFYGDDATRAERKIADIEILKRGTRSQSGFNEVFYVINYEDESGFALVSADHRTESVYGISNKGSLHLSDTVDNRGLSWYFNEYIVDNNSAYVPIDSTNRHPVVIPVVRDHIYSEPLLTGMLSSMHQHYPYNKYCRTIKGESAPVGCLPLAVGTIMAYYQWPKSYDSYSFQWSEMLWNSYNDGWPRLFDYLDKSNNLNTQHGVSGSSASMNDVVRTFINFGYAGAKYQKCPLIGYGITDELENNRPVIICGDDISKKEAHAWIIDGARLHTVDYGGSTGVDNIHNLYYHCVWGWGTKANGYFLVESQRLGGNSASQYDHSDGSAPVYKFRDVIYGYTPNK